MTVHEPLHTWLVAIIAGILIGFISVILGGFGLALGLALVVGAGRTRERVFAVGGVLMGFGLAWTVMWSRADLQCRPATCQDLDAGAWLAASIAIAVVGIVVSVAGLYRGRR